ncbi:Putative aspartate aminotransferase [Bordetella sputigena]|uniref:pyridoxal phosphate-dependent aminotransferase n=1 Tax=Bordetella sputigena TaxID=1416810 RepID=UPI0039EF520A
MQATMTRIEEKFQGLGVDSAPGQEVRQHDDALAGLAIGEALEGPAVDFSHGDVGADAFPPTPGALGLFVDGYERGGAQAYTEYRGDGAIRELVAERLARFTGAAVSAGDAMILTPGTQSALFLAVLSTVTAGDQVAIVQPDYFANRKLVEFAGARAVPVRLGEMTEGPGAGIDLGQLEDAFRAGARTFLFSNPNNPVGAVYSPEEIAAIARLAETYGVTVIVDQLYARLRYAGTRYTHLRAQDIDPSRVLTIMGPSKTESLSGFRLGLGFGAPAIVARMEKLQAIVSLRAPGYCQAVLRTWFAEPENWLADRIAAHQAIRDDLLGVFRGVDGVRVRTPDAGSYLFPELPLLTVPHAGFVRLLRAQAGVTVTPGTEFSPHAGARIRLNFSQNHERAVRGASRIAAMVERYRQGA